MFSVFEKLVPFLKDPVVLTGICLIVSFLVVRLLLRKQTIQGWRPTLVHRLLRRLLLGAYIPVLGVLLVGIGVGLKGLRVEKELEPGVNKMTFQGTLNIAGAQAFLIPDPNQVLTKSTLMMMKDIPPGGTPNERIDAAPSYFTVTLKKVNGDQITVTGTVSPFGSGQVLVVDK